MPENVINLLIQLPLVGIFVWFILAWSKQLNDGEARRDEQWREFLKEERQHRAEGLARLAKEIKSVSQQVNKLNGLLSAHDASSREARLAKARSGAEEPKKGAS